MEPSGYSTLKCDRSMLKVLHTSQTLITFENRIKEAFLNKEIASPIHLSGGNEQQIIEIFQDIRDQDWVFSTWRSHYHALLKGISEDWLYDEILAGRSMMIHSKEHRFLTSSIVGGILPIALGVAMGIQKNGGSEQVYVFVGDMTAKTGIYHEAANYAAGHNLPINFIVEDNGVSTNTPTMIVWGNGSGGWKPSWYKRYGYSRTFPHTGVGQWVDFG
jgi:TPP-dependent pyruvate/acetoin dehydrogenase alpha subunit